MIFGLLVAECFCGCLLILAAVIWSSVLPHVFLLSMSLCFRIGVLVSFCFSIHLWVVDFFATAKDILACASQFRPDIGASS